MDGATQLEVPKGNGVSPQGIMGMGPTLAEAARAAALAKTTARRLNEELEGAKEPVVAKVSRDEAITPVEMASRMNPMEMAAQKLAGAKRGLMEDAWLSKS